jgi:hypothetical protein
MAVSVKHWVADLSVCRAAVPVVAVLPRPLQHARELPVFAAATSAFTVSGSSSNSATAAAWSIVNSYRTDAALARSERATARA